MRKWMPAIVTMFILAGFATEARAQAPCTELLRLRNTANEVWKQAMSGPPSERCRALRQAASAMEATLSYANSNRESCGISVALLHDVEDYNRKAEQARDNVCAGRPLRPYPPDIIRH